MNSLTEAIYNFVIATPERLQTAYEISKSWDEIRSELVKRFQGQIVSRIKDCLSDLPEVDEIEIKIENSNTDRWSIWVYKKSWNALICPVVEGMLAKDYWGVCRDDDKIKLKPKLEQRLIKYWKEHKLPENGSEPWWFFKEDTGSDFNDIHSLTQVLNEEISKPLVQKYSTTLAEYFRKYHKHIDEMIAMM